MSKCTLAGRCWSGKVPEVISCKCLVNILYGPVPSESSLSTWSGLGVHSSADGRSIKASSWAPAPPTLAVCGHTFRRSKRWFFQPLAVQSAESHNLRQNKPVKAAVYMCLGGNAAARSVIRMPALTAAPCMRQADTGLWLKPWWMQLHPAARPPPPRVSWWRICPH